MTQERREHTAGEWSTGNYFGSSEFDVVADGYTIATTDTKSLQSAAERRSNAHLIAAAPDLMAVVKDMLSGLAYLRETNSVPYGFGIDRLEESGQLALLKAQGTNP